MSFRYTSWHELIKGYIEDIDGLVQCQGMLCMYECVLHIKIPSLGSSFLKA